MSLAVSDSIKAGLKTAESQGESAIVLLDDQQVLALFGLADQVREQARTAVQRLREIGCAGRVDYRRC